MNTQEDGRKEGAVVSVTSTREPPLSYQYLSAVVVLGSCVGMMEPPLTWRGMVVRGACRVTEPVSSISVP